MILSVMKRNLEEEKEPTEQSKKKEKVAGKHGGRRKGAGLLLTPLASYVLLPSKFPRIVFAGTSSTCIKTASALGHHYHHRLPAPTLHISSPKNGMWISVCKHH